MSLFLTFTLVRVLGRCDLTWGSREEPLTKHFVATCTPPINHGLPPFSENKRYRANPRPMARVVNRKADAVYQTEAVLDFIHHVRKTPPASRKTISPATKQYRVRPCPRICPRTFPRRFRSRYPRNFR